MVGLEATRLSCGVAIVSDADTDPAKLATGQITAVRDVNPDAFSDQVQAEILRSEQNLLVFVHGFANSFSDAITRAAFNREWFAASGEPAADCTVIAFTWPSAGRVVNGEDALPGVISIGQTILGFLLNKGIQNPLANAYRDDQKSAASSGRDLARTIDRLAPLFNRVREQGRTVHLLVHSMGHVVLQRALENWTVAGQRPGTVFDQAALCAGDADWDLGGKPPDWLLAMPGLARRTLIYRSTSDDILWISDGLNNTRRLGLSGPEGWGDAAQFPAPAYCRIDCAAAHDSAGGKEVDSSHQYYRRIPAVRQHIAASFAGASRKRDEKI